MYDTRASVIGHLHDQDLPILENDRVSDARGKWTMSTHFIIQAALSMVATVGQQLFQVPWRM
jgi:hypothetical protein